MPDSIRKNIARAVIVGVFFAGPLLSGCGSAASGGSGAHDVPCGSDTEKATSDPLVYWSSDDRMRGVVEVWNQQNPTLPVAVEIQPEAEMLTKLKAALDAGRQPDLADVSVLDVPGLVHAGDLACYTVAPDYQRVHAHVGLGRPYFPWGTPADLDPIAIFFRKESLAELAELKLEPSPQPWTLDPSPLPWITHQQLAVLAQAYRERFGQPLISIDLKGDPALFSALVWQRGGTWFHLLDDAKTFQVSIDDPETREVAKYWDTLIGAGAVATVDTRTAVMSTSTPFVVAPLSMAALLKTEGASQQWGVGLFAQSDGDDNDRCGTVPGRYHVIPHRGPGDPPRSEAAIEFMRWLTGDPASLQAQLRQGILPASLSAYALADIEALDAFYGVDGLAAVAKVSVAGLGDRFEYGPNMAFVYAEQTRLFEARTLEASLETLELNTVADLETSYPVTP